MIRLFASHPTAANILMLALLALGLAAVPTLQRDTFPVVPPSVVEVRVAYPGASPAEVENGICLLLETPIRAVDNLEELTCQANDNLAVLSAEIVEGADMGRFNDDIKAAVEGASGLPERAEKPVTRIVERVASVASVAITGLADPAALYAYGDGLAEMLKTDPAISQADLGGFSDREIAIEIPAQQLQRHGLTISDIAGILGRSSIDLPAGTMETPEGDIAIRFVNERRSPEEIGRIPVIGSTLGAEVFLGDIAKIAVAFADPAQAAYFNGARAAVVTISKTEAQDALRVMAALEARLAIARQTAPEGIRLAIATDTTSNIRDRLQIIFDNGLQGLGLVLVVMWLFFGFRFSFWVAAGLPVSFLGTVFAMQVMGLTINMITMVALLVAIGLLMDDAIVISENIMRRRQAGEPALTVAANGAAQVAPGVFSSFLTTVMIVGPLGLMAGQIGAVLKFLPIVLVITLIVSLVEAFLILPHHLHHALENTREGAVQRRVNRAFDAVRDRVVMPLSRLSLRFRYLTVGLIVMLMLVSVAPVTGGFVKFQSFPSLDSDTVEARLLLPDGSPLWRTEQRVKKVVAALTELDQELTPKQPGGAKLVQNVTVSYGVNIDAAGTGANMATVSTGLLRAESRATGVTEIVDSWRKLTGPMPDMAAIRFTDKERGVGGKPIDIRLKGEDLGVLKATARDLRAFFREFEGVRDVIDDLRPGKPEYVVTIKPAAASALGVTAQSIASQLRAAFRGDTGLEVLDGSGGLDIVARLAAADRNGSADLSEIRINGPDGALVPLSAVAEITATRGYATITRLDGQRTVSVQGTINPAVANSRDLMAEMKRSFLPALAETHPEIAVEIAGEAKDTSTTGTSLAKNLGLGFVGVFLILAFQFRSFVQPISVIAAIPLGVIGVIWGHIALGMQLSLPSMVGLATLAGVVVNDSILLIGFIKDRFAEGAEMLEAAEAAVRDRLRAIFLTSLTTVVGLGPLLLEQSTQAQFLRPIVASLAFGLTGATLFAVFLTPAIFAILHDLGVVTRAAEVDAKKAG